MPLQPSSEKSTFLATFAAVGFLVFVAMTDGSHVPILFFFSSDKEKLTAGSDEKTQRSPARDRTQGLVNSSRTL